MNKLWLIPVLILHCLPLRLAIGSEAAIPTLRVEINQESHYGYRERHVVELSASKLRVDGVEIPALLLPAAIHDLRNLRSIEPNRQPFCFSGSFSQSVDENGAVKIQYGCTDDKRFRELWISLQHLQNLAVNASE